MGPGTPRPVLASDTRDKSQGVRTGRAGKTKMRKFRTLIVSTFPSLSLPIPLTPRLSSGRGGMRAAPSYASLRRGLPHRGWPLTGSWLDTTVKAGNRPAGSAEKNTALTPHIGRTQLSGGGRQEQDGRRRAVPPRGLYGGRGGAGSLCRQQ